MLATILSYAALIDTDLFKFIGRLHILALHLPIGILSLALFSSLLRFLRLRIFNDQAQLGLLLFGSVSALAAVLCGLALAQEESQMSELLIWHMYTGIGVLVTSVSALYAFKKSLASPQRWPSVKQA